MQPIAAPITRFAKGLPVSNLQDALQYLLNHRGLQVTDADRAAYAELLAREQLGGQFSDGTSRLVGLFQEQHALAVTGEVDDRTAEVMDDALAKSAVSARRRRNGSCGARWWEPTGP